MCLPSRWKSSTCTCPEGMELKTKGRDHGLTCQTVPSTSKNDQFIMNYFWKNGKITCCRPKRVGAPSFPWMIVDPPLIQVKPSGSTHTCDLLGVNYYVNFLVHAITKNKYTTHY